jgi:AraC-like DNA-binding protein
MSFSKIKDLITALTRDSAFFAAVAAAAGDRRVVVQARSFERLLWLARERPVTAVVLDSEAMPSCSQPDGGVADLRLRFPSLAAVFVARPGLDAFTLLRLGRAGISQLNLIALDDLEAGFRDALARSTAGSTQSLVMRSVGVRLTRPWALLIRTAMEGALLGWKADELAAEAGWTRAHLSVRLKAAGLPSAGRLLLWAKLLHAGRWLEESGRTAESVARQLEYSDGAAFRRALRNYLGATPTEVREGGGFGFVLGRFLDVCGLGDSLGADRIVA